MIDALYLPPKPAIILPRSRELIQADDARKLLLAGGLVINPHNFKVQTQIAQGEGTAIGNMTANGGLAAGFDGTASQAAAACAAFTGVSVTSYIGKSFGATKIISGFKYWPSNDQGVHAGAGNQQLQVWVKTGSDPSSDTDGTFIGGTPEAADTTSMQENLALTKTVADRVWVRVISTGTTDNKFCGEVQFFEEI